MTRDAAATTGTAPGLNQLRMLDTVYAPGAPSSVGADPGTASRSLEFATLLDRAAAVNRRRDAGTADRRRPGTPEVIGRPPADHGPIATTATPTPRIDLPAVERVAAGRSRQTDNDRRTPGHDRTTPIDQAGRADRDQSDPVDRPVDRGAAGGVDGPDPGADDDPTSETTTADGQESQVVAGAAVMANTTTSPADADIAGVDPNGDGAIDPGANALGGIAGGAVQSAGNGTVQAGATGALGDRSGAAAGTTAATGDDVPDTSHGESEGAEMASEMASETALEAAPSGADPGGAEIAPTATDPNRSVDPAPADPNAVDSSGPGNEGGTQDGSGQGHSAHPDQAASSPVPVQSALVTGAAAPAATGATIPGVGGAGDAKTPVAAGDGPPSALSGPATSDLDLGLVPTATTQTTIGGPASAESGAAGADPVWRQVQRALNTVRLTAAGDHELTIRLRPEELGSVLVTVTTGEAGTTVSLMADSRGAANQLLAQRHLLLDQLSDRGLAGATVDVGLGDSSGRSDSGPGTARDNDSRSALTAASNPGARAEHQPNGREASGPRTGTSGRVDVAL